MIPFTRKYSNVRYLDSRISNRYIKLFFKLTTKISSTAIPENVDEPSEVQADDLVEAAHEAYEAEDILFELEDFEDENSKTLTAAEGLAYKKQVVGIRSST